MSLAIAGVWAVGVWDQSVWANGVWYEATPENRCSLQVDASDFLAVDADGRLAISEDICEVATTPTDANTGGFGAAYSRYRDESEKRRQRIAFGIIPDDTPPEVVEALTEASRQPVDVLARRKLRALTDKSAELDGLLGELMQAQRESEIEARKVFIDELNATRLTAESNLQQQQNATAVLVMLSLMQ